MNLIDLAIVAVIGLSIAFGLYSGLISSLVNMLGLGISWVCAFTMYGSLSNWIIENTSLMDQIVHYTEGASHIASMEIANTAVSGAMPSFVQQVVADAGFPAPFDGMLLQNILGEVFRGQGLTTMADYFNYTLAYAVLNIISFLLILGILYILFSLLGMVVSFVMQFPVLRQCDSLLGGCFGLARGLIIVFALFMLLPIVLAVLPLDFLSEMVEASRLSPLFQDHNFFLSTIKSVL